MRPERADLRPERADMGPERANLRPLRADLRSGREDKWTNGWNDGQTKVPLCSTGLCPLRGPLPRNASNLAKLGQFDQIFFLS